MSPLESAKRLAVLGGEQRGEAVELLLHEVEELEHDARTALRVDRGPARLRRLRRSAIACSISARLASATLAWTSPVLGLNTSPNRPERALDLLAADEVADLAHLVLLLPAQARTIAHVADGIAQPCPDGKPASRRGWPHSRVPYGGGISAKRATLPLKRGRVGEGVAGGKRQRSVRTTSWRTPNPPPFRGRE